MIMSCNGCRILRKGCNNDCILRESIKGIDSPQAQANATLFVAKFFGRAGLISFLSSVPHSQRPALFHSLLFEACGRTVNPVNGALGLLSTGNWHLCQTAVDTVLSGGALRPYDFDLTSDPHHHLVVTNTKGEEGEGGPSTPKVMMMKNKKRPASPPSDDSDTTTLDSDLDATDQNPRQTKLLRLFF